MNAISLGLFLAQSEKITNWLTPVWILLTGIGAGFLVVLCLWAILLGLSRIGGLNRLYESTVGRWVGGLVAGLAIFGGLFYYTWRLGYWTPGETSANEDWGSHLFLMIFFYGLGSLIAGFGLIALVSEKRSDELRVAPWSGFLLWVSVICIGAVVYSGLAYGLAKAKGFGVLVPVDNPDMLLRSAAQLPETGTWQTTISVPSPTPSEGMVIPDSAIKGWQVSALLVRTGQPIEMATKPIALTLPRDELLDIPKTDDQFWSFYKTAEDKVFPRDYVDQMYLANRGTGPTEVTLIWFTAPEFPQAFLFYWAAGSVIVLYLGYFMFALSLPKVFAIAHSTFKTEVSQPLFLILLLVGLIFVVASIYIPYNTFGEDIKMYKDSGLTLIRVLGIFLAVWAASKSLAEEIEGRTALTVLSKPVSRRQFILGKYTGIGLAVALLFIIVGVWFVIWVSYKPIYDSRESTVRNIEWENCFRESILTVPGLVLCWFEAMIFAAISVVISTRLGILANFMICFAIYVIGHLTALIVQSTEVAQSFEGIVVFGQLISIIFPVLDHFDIHAAITGDVAVPMSYIGWSAIYCGLYGLIALLLALVLFEDRDLA